MSATIHDIAEHRSRKALEAWGQRYMEDMRRELAERLRARRLGSPDRLPNEGPAA